MYFGIQYSITTFITNNFCLLFIMLTNVPSIYVPTNLFHISRRVVCEWWFIYVISHNFSIRQISEVSAYIVNVCLWIYTGCLIKLATYRKHFYCKVYEKKLFFIEILFVFKKVDIQLFTFDIECTLLVAKDWKK